VFIQILKHTPVWVWAILAVVIVLGLSQARTRRVGLRRATLLPLIFIGFSLSGVIGAFGHGLALVEWLAGVAIAVMLLGNLVAVRGAEWSPGTQQFTVPGSFVPVTLIVGVFLLKYAVIVALTLHPERAHDTAFTSACAVAYGGVAGLFWARARSLRRFARTETLSMEQGLMGP
jgi:hypothetical protein